MEKFNVAEYESRLETMFAEVEQRVLKILDLTPTKMTFTNDPSVTEVLTYVRYPLKDLSEPDFYTKSADYLANIFAEQIAYTGTKTISPLIVMPNHEFRKMSLGYIICFMVSPTVTGPIKIAQHSIVHEAGCEVAREEPPPPV